MSYKIPGSIWKNITPGCTQETDPEFLNPVQTVELLMRTARQSAT